MARLSPAGDAEFALQACCAACFCVLCKAGAGFQRCIPRSMAKKGAAAKAGKHKAAKQKVSALRHCAAASAVIGSRLVLCRAARTKSKLLDPRRQTITARRMCRSPAKRQTGSCASMEAAWTCCRISQPPSWKSAASGFLNNNVCNPLLHTEQSICTPRRFLKRPTAAETLFECLLMLQAASCAQEAQA